MVVVGVLVLRGEERRVFSGIEGVAAVVVRVCVRACVGANGDGGLVR